MALSETQVRNAKPGVSPYKLADGESLYLLVQPSGSRLWRMNYKFDGRYKTLAFGAYPAVKLVEAREQRAAAKARLRRGEDPGVARALGLDADAPVETFERIAKEWFATREGALVPAYAVRVWARLREDVIPEVGHLPITDIKPKTWLEVFRKIEGRGAIEMAKRVKQSVSQIYGYAIATDRAESDPTARLGPALKPSPRVRHFAKLAATDLPEFMVRLRNYQGDEVTRLSLELLLRTWTRTKEIRLAPKSEFVGDLWRIPAARMKMSRDHLVPLTPQARAIVDRLMEISEGPLLTAGFSGQPMSENTLIYAMYRMGYHSRATVHGLRGTASTIANESGRWRQDSIERQLAHAPDDEVRAAYNAAEYLTERREILTWWSAYLDGQLEIGDLLGVE